MKSGGRSYRTLDKDLGSITHTETAQQYAFRPVLWLGIGSLLLVAGLIFAIAVNGDRLGPSVLAAGLVVAGWLGISIGSNDVANSLGPAVGAGAIRLLPGLVMVAVAEIAGASLAGAEVTQRLASGLFNPDFVPTGTQAQIVMLSALIAAAVWITFATSAGLPVSTSHSIVGGIAGAAIAALGFSAIHVETLLLIATTWVLTPFAAGAIAGALLVFLRLRVIEAKDRAGAAMFWFPLLIGILAGFFAAYLVLLAEQYLPPLLALPAGIVAACAGLILTREKLRRDLTLDQGKVSAKKIFRPALVVSAAMLGFAHGANDVGNVAGPFSVILDAHASGMPGAVPLLLLLAAGGSIAIGTVLFGRRLVIMVGSGITRLNAARAFCVTLATAGTVLVTTSFGLPVSTTHVAIGGVFGVGFAREWLDRMRAKTHDTLPAEEERRRVLIRRSHVATITVAWLVTVPITAGLGALCCYAVLRSTGA